MILKMLLTEKLSVACATIIGLIISSGTQGTNVFTFVLLVI